MNHYYFPRIAELLPGKPVNILFVLEGFFPYQKAGTEVYVLNLSKYLIRKGFKISALIARTDGTRDYAFENIPVYTFQIPAKPIASELNGQIPPRGLDQFLIRVSEIKPDIIHFHSLGRAINSYHIEEVSKRGYRTVFTAHLGSNICIRGDFQKFGEKQCDGLVTPHVCLACKMQESGQNKFTSGLAARGISMMARVGGKMLPASLLQAHHRRDELDRLKKYCDVIIAIAPWIQEALYQNGLGHRTALVKQGIHEQFLHHHDTKEFRRSAVPVKLGFIGRMHPHKGFHLLKEALSKLDQKGWELNVVTFKSHDQSSYVDEMFAWTKERENIIWKENLDQPQVAQVLDQIDLLVLPSISNEMAPLIILEAQARNVPTLGSSYPAITDLVKDKITGRIFQNGSAENLQNCLSEVLSNPSLIDEWKKNLPQPRTFSDVAREMEEIYCSL